MADYSNIVDEFETIANAFTSVNYFRYDRVSSMNGQQKAKGYPMILVTSTPNTSRGVSNTSYLPKRKEFTFKVFCYDLYNTAQKNSYDLQTAQATVDKILDQYIAEFISRNIDGANGFSIVDREQISGFMAHDVLNDKLIQSVYDVKIALDSDCTTGTFSY